MGTRSLGITSEIMKDQYADGKIAKLYDTFFIGDSNIRTQNYKDILVGLLKRKGCKRILDVACGTGVDSIMLVEEGFEVVSVDASDKMLKYALKARWSRRKEEAFDKWVIEEANWLTLYDDIDHLVGNGFDAIICLGSSFAYVLDNYGDQREQKQALRNFEKCLKPGGLLLVDHRNYDDMLDSGIQSSTSKNIYFNGKKTKDIKTSVLYVNGKPTLITRDYVFDTSMVKKKDDNSELENSISEMRISYYPHKREAFKKILKEVFGENSEHTVYADFQPLNEVDVPHYYIHVIEKNNREI